MKITYYKQAGGYIAVTNECPPTFKNVIFVGRGTKPGGTGLDDIIEQCYTVTDLKKLTAVNKHDVPDGWVIALGYEKPMVKVLDEPRPVVLPQGIDMNKWLFVGAVIIMSGLFLYQLLF